MSADWHLRLARREDALEIPGVELAASALFSADPTLAGLEPGRVWPVDALQRLIGKGHCLVAHVGERLAGFLVTEPMRRDLHLWEMSVHPDFQRRRIGAGLVRACQIDARNAGFARLTLTTFRDLAWNAPFYARLGFVEQPEPVTEPHLAELLRNEAAQGLPRDRRCAMACLLS